MFIACVQPTTAALIAEYTDSHAAPDLPASEERLTTSALRCFGAGRAQQLRALAVEEDDRAQAEVELH